MKTAVSNKAIFFWNIMGSLSTAGISVVLLMAVTHILPLEDADLYSFAYAFSSLMIMISLFQIRNFQSTDVQKHYCFEEYLLTRILTSLAMLLVVLVYLVWNDFDAYKSAILFYTCLYRLTDSFSDVYQGFFQQHGRLDLAGKFLFWRNSLIFVVFLLVLVLTQNLLLALQLVCLVSFLLVLMTDVRASFAVEAWNWRQMWSQRSFKNSYILLLQTSPLFINGFLLMYIYNKPKYVLEELFRQGSVVAGEQTIFNILFMPAFVMNLLILFFRPMITQAAVFLSKKELASFKRTTGRLFLYLALSTLAIMLGAGLLGTRFLSLLYSVDVKAYWLAFMCLMLGGVFSSFGAALDNIITAMRQQHLLILSYLASFLVSQAITSFLIREYSMLGAGLSFCLSMMTWAITSFIVYYFSYRKQI